MTAGRRYAFGPFEVDGRVPRLQRAGQPVPMSDRYLRVLLHLVARAGDVIAKNELVTAGWGGVAVTDNSLEQAISTLRRVLGHGPDGRPYVETVPRQGYRLTASVTTTAAPESDETIEALLAPHSAWIDGRAALESLERSEILRARGVFTRVVETIPDSAAAHVGLANACVLQFEMTRADQTPDVDAVRAAVHHARQACRLDTSYGEAWATLGFVLERAGSHADALAAARRSIALEPDNWRHHLRLSSLGWGEERLRAARRTLSLLPGCALAHWLAATVLVARQRLDEAARELDAGIAAELGRDAHARFSGVALHWLLGLIHLARGHERQAVEEFERELSSEGTGHLYARECCANTWYAIGALRLRRQRMVEASEAFAEALRRVPNHPLAHVGLSLAARRPDAPPPTLDLPPSRSHSAIDDALGLASLHVHRGSPAEAAHVVDAALSSAPPGSAAWLLPIEPLLHVDAAPDLWVSPLTRLHARAA